MGNIGFDRGHFKITLTPKAGGPAVNDEGRYVVLLEKGADGTPYFGGAEAWLGDAVQLDQCLTQRLERDGYNVRDPRIIGPLAILHLST